MVQARAEATYNVEPDFAARQSILWAVAWLVGGVTITLVTHVLLLRPELGFELPFLSYGRLRGVADTTIVFGWLGTIAFAAIFALIPRIAEVQLHNEALGAATTVTWSLLLTGGIIALLLGINQGRPLAELPFGVDVGLLLMFVFVLYNAGVTVVRRRETTLYVSGWYLLAAALLAPLVFLIGNLTAFRGTTDIIVSGFYLNGLEMLWLLPVALGIAHYVVPVETGNALYSSALTRAGFWSLIFAGGWAGQRYFLHGPAPDYLETIAVAMTIVLVLPVISTVANLFATGRDRWELGGRSLGLRFAAAGLGLLVAWIALVVVSAIPSVSRYVGHTSWQTGVRYLAVFGVFSSFGFAFAYHAYPLMVGRDWYSRSLASLHFWTTQIGVIATTALLLATGAAQAAAAATAAGVETDVGVVNLLRVLTAGAFGVVAIAQYAFAYNIFRTARSGPLVQGGAAPAAVGSSA